MCRGSIDMPTQDWSRVNAGIFQDFHHAWIYEISRSLNNSLLPSDYYAMVEKHGRGLCGDVRTSKLSNELQGIRDAPRFKAGNGGTVSFAPPPVALTAEGEMEFYRRKQNSVVVRHVSGHRIVAMIEIVSPGNKSSQYALDSFVQKACDIFDQDIHLLVLDLHPPGPRDAAGIHGAIWEEFTGKRYSLPAGRPFTLAAYECDLTVRAYVQHAAIGDSLPGMPLFLAPRAHVLVPLEDTYQVAFDAVPRVWRSVLE
jgi:hypothetical protein